MFTFGQKGPKLGPLIAGALDTPGALDFTKNFSKDPANEFTQDVTYDFSKGFTENFSKDFLY